MKNQLVARVMGNQLLSKVVGEVTKFCTTNKSTIITVIGIGSSVATTGVAMRNSVEINRVIFEAREALAACNTNEERNQVYSLMLKELVPLVAPILILQGTTITCMVLSKRHSDKLEARLAETAGALSIAQTAIAQYQSFQKEAEKALGEEKYAEIQDDIYKEQVIDGRRFTSLASEGAPGEGLFIDKYSGRPFWCTRDVIKYAVREMNRVVSKDGEPVTIDDYYGLIGNKDLTDNQNESLLAQRFGYLPGHDVITPHFADSHYVFPNGSVVQCAEVYLYPEPDYIDIC